MSNLVLTMAKLVVHFVQDVPPYLLLTKGQDVEKKLKHFYV